MMKGIFEITIKNGGYDLASMLAKIDKYHVAGKLTDEERDELYAMARENAKGQYNYRGEIERLWAAVRALQKANEVTEEGAQEETTDDWKQPTGAHDAYMTGDLMRFTDGLVYESLKDHNIYPPTVMPDWWKVREEA